MVPVEHKYMHIMSLKNFHKNGKFHYLGQAEALTLSPSFAPDIAVEFVADCVCAGVSVSMAMSSLLSLTGTQSGSWKNRN